MSNELNSKSEGLGEKITIYTLGTIVIGALSLAAFSGTYHYGYTKGKIAKKQEIISKLRDGNYILMLNSSYIEHLSRQDSSITRIKLDSLETVVNRLESMK